MAIPQKPFSQTGGHLNRPAQPTLPALWLKLRHLWGYYMRHSYRYSAQGARRAEPKSDRRIFPPIWQIFRVNLVENRHLLFRRKAASASRRITLTKAHDAVGLLSSNPAHRLTISFPYFPLPLTSHASLNFVTQRYHLTYSFHQAMQKVKVAQEGDRSMIDVNVPTLPT